MPRHYIHKTVKNGHHEEKLKIAICEVLSGRSSIRKAAERYGLAKLTIGSYSKRHHACGLLPSCLTKKLLVRFCLLLFMYHIHSRSKINNVFHENYFVLFVLH